MSQVKFIVLRKMRYGESDLILHGLTPNGSKISMIARAALKSRKRFGGGILEPTHYLQGEVTSKNKMGQQELYTLKEATLLEDFSSIKADYDRLDLAFYVLSTVDQVAQEDDLDAENIFHLVGNTLRSLASLNLTDWNIFKLQFEYKLLNYLGVLDYNEKAVPLLKAKMGDELEFSADDLWYLQQRSQDGIERYRKGLAGI